MCNILSKVKKHTILEKKNVAYFRWQLFPREKAVYWGFFFPLRPSKCWKQNLSSVLLKDKYTLQTSPMCSHFHTLWLFLLLSSGTIGELFFSPHLCAKCTAMRGIDGQSESSVPCHCFHQAGHFWEPSRTLTSRNIRPYPEMACY